MKWQWFEFYKGTLINLLDFDFIVESLLGALVNVGFHVGLNYTLGA